MILDKFWTLLGLIFTLKSEAFELVLKTSHSYLAAIIIVLAAGLSGAIAQSIILFINRVKPIRFIFSLLLNAILFTFGFLFLVISTWLTLFLFSSTKVNFLLLATVLGVSHAPLILNFFGALPYLGVPILSILSVWHLLAMVVGVSEVTGFTAGGAFAYVVLGWLVLQILQNTIGQPIANLGRWLADKAAGVELATRRSQIQEILQAGLTQISSPPTIPTQNNISVGQINLNPTPINSPSSSVAYCNIDNYRTQREDRLLKTILGLLGMAFLSFGVVVLLEPLRLWVFSLYYGLPSVVKFVLDLIWIGTVAIIIAGLLAPLETLGWWAGWYQDEIDTTVNAGSLAQPIVDQGKISRYLVYLDGIGKSTFEYLEDVEDFLVALTANLPEDMALLRDIIPYSVLNNPLDEDRPLAFLWRKADKSRSANPASLLGILVNLRNVLIVAVSADQRYGPLYNQGIAQVIYNGLINNGYQPNSGIPITLIGYSGGGQMSAACAPFLRRALNTPIDVISLGGVISGNCNVLKLEHLYHLVGDKDGVEKIGPIFFPGRWKILPLSYWNRAKRRGKISVFSLGAVGHQVPGGLMDPNFILADGRSALEQTIDLIMQILRDDIVVADEINAIKPSNYQLYKQAAFNRPDYYPIDQSISSDLYRPMANWMGRLILPKPEQRRKVKGILFEVYHAEDSYQHLVGRVVNLRWRNNPNIQALLQAVRRDVHFSAEAEYTSKYGGLIHPERLNHWQNVGPLESLAGSRPYDDLIVMLSEPVSVEELDNQINLYIETHPVEISGRFYGLVKFVKQVNNNGDFLVIHFNRVSRQFDGVEEIVSLPQVIADQNGCFPSTSRNIENSPLNEMGWYIYGAKNHSGIFIVQSIAPRALLRLQPQEVIFGQKAAYNYIRNQAWDDIVSVKGKISSVLLSTQEDSIQEAIASWQEGDRALILHVYGGIGGNKREPAAASPIFFGHFAYGIARVIREPLSNELSFDIRYYQVYTHNTDGLVAGVLHWSRYLGDRQFGWVGTRPVADLLIKYEPFTGYYDFNGVKRSPLENAILQLEAMTARYRIGDGTGGTYVGPANNCSQDSNQALFASIRQIEREIKASKDLLSSWMENNPNQARCFEELLKLQRLLKRELQPFGAPRHDWENNEYNLGTTLEDEPLRNLITGLGSWRTMLPRKANDTIVKIFLQRGASVWVLRTNQIGGCDPDIEPIAPMTFGI